MPPCSAPEQARNPGLECSMSVAPQAILTTLFLGMMCTEQKRVIGAHFLSSKTELSPTVMKMYIMGHTKVVQATV